jgi:hypothetical protein
MPVPESVLALLLVACKRHESWHDAAGARHVPWHVFGARGTGERYALRRFDEVC